MNLYAKNYVVSVFYHSALLLSTMLYLVNTLEKCDMYRHIYYLCLLAIEYLTSAYVLIVSEYVYGSACNLLSKLPLLCHVMSFVF